jgi:hypothetical protein
MGILNVKSGKFRRITLLREKSWLRRFASALSDQVESPDRKEFAPIQ